jgi:hypothetical protein
MVNEDIVTALRNAVDRGESLENAMRMLVNSGYPPNDVQDASKFVSFIPISNNKNILDMPEKKILIKNNPIQPAQIQQIQPQILPPKLPPPNSLQQIQQFSNQNPKYPAAQQLPQRTPTNNEIKSEISSKPSQIPRYPPQQLIMPAQIQQQAQETPKKPSYTKEIILLIILLLLISILIATILFRSKILSFFS